jgi:hypothetical protein
MYETGFHFVVYYIHLKNLKILIYKVGASFNLFQIHNFNLLRKFEFIRSFVYSFFLALRLEMARSDATLYIYMQK